MLKKTYALCEIQHIVQFESPVFIGSRELFGDLKRFNKICDIGRERSGEEGAIRIFERHFFVTCSVLIRVATFAGGLSEAGMRLTAFGFAFGRNSRPARDEREGQAGAQVRLSRHQRAFRLAFPVADPITP
ncbi:hypothetical protein EY04_07360 [Pseudomonas chlororaphis]|nr:hypothetical protein EY04_07360 [Pseudomonas chlororaphis]QHC88249.1 hypothetical protein PchlR47_07900 [Pseudomonas chlororaphis]